MEAELAWIGRWIRGQGRKSPTPGLVIDDEIGSCCFPDGRIPMLLEKTTPGQQIQSIALPGMPGSHAVVGQFAQKAIQLQIIRAIRFRINGIRSGTPAERRASTRSCSSGEVSSELMIIREEDFHPHIHLSCLFGRSDMRMIPERRQIVHFWQNWDHYSTDELYVNHRLSDSAL